MSAPLAVTADTARSSASPVPTGPAASTSTVTGGCGCWAGEGTGEGTAEGVARVLHGERTPSTVATVMSSAVAEITSYAESNVASEPSSTRSASIAAAALIGARNAHAVSGGRRSSSTATRVTTPNAPAEPIRNEVADGPVLSLRSRVRSSSTVGRSEPPGSTSASTACRPITRRRTSPLRNIRAPPVFVATIPPRHGSAPRSIGSTRSWAASRSFKVERCTPAGTIATRSSGNTSIGSMSRSVLRIISGRCSERAAEPAPVPDPLPVGAAGGGTDAPTSPEFAPCGSSRTPWRTAQRITTRTSSVDAGRTTPTAWPPVPRAGCS